MAWHLLVVLTLKKECFSFPLHVWVWILERVRDEGGGEEWHPPNALGQAQNERSPLTRSGQKNISAPFQCRGIALSSERDRDTPACIIAPNAMSLPLLPLKLFCLFGSGTKMMALFIAAFIALAPNSEHMPPRLVRPLFHFSASNPC